MELLPLLIPLFRFSRSGLSKLGTGTSSSLPCPWNPLPASALPSSAALWPSVHLLYSDGIRWALKKKRLVVLPGWDLLRNHAEKQVPVAPTSGASEQQWFWMESLSGPRCP